MERGFLALEDGEWEKADTFFEHALNFDARLARAYFGKMMVELKVKKEEELESVNKNLEDNLNYQKVLRFGDKNIISFLQNINKKLVKKLNENALLIQRAKEFAELILADSYRTLGLKSDGTVVASGDNEYVKCNIQDWKLF